MTPDGIAALSVGVALAALMLALWRNLSARMDRLDARQAADIRDVRADVQALTARVNDLDRRLARMEGVIEGLAFANGRARPDPDRSEAAA